MLRFYLSLFLLLELYELAHLCSDFIHMTSNIIFKPLYTKIGFLRVLP